MQGNSKWRRYLRFFGPDLKADIEDELQFHIETKQKEFIAQGCTPQEARKRATAHFGNIQEVSTMCREIDEQRTRELNLSERIADWRKDIRNAFRALRRAPAFTAIAILTLAGGIAGATALFSIIDAWIIHSVRLPEPDQVLSIRSLNIRQGREITMSTPDFVDLKERSSSLLRYMSAWSDQTFTLSLQVEPERIPGVRVSSDFFSALGIQPVIGRAFQPNEAELGRHHVAIVSHGFWKARLHGDTAALGSTIHLDGEPYTVIGVLPEDFHFTVTGRANVWIPLAQSAEEAASRQTRALQIVARMKSGVTLNQVSQALTAAAADLAAKYPGTNRDVGASAVTMHTETGRHTGASLIWVVFAVSIGLLVIACSNVANLLLVRAQARQRQASIQLSLGAGRGRLVRAALIETLLLFVIASALGAVLANALITFVCDMIPFENRGYLPGYGTASMSPSVLLFALGISLATGLIFGLAPAFESTRANVLAVLKESGSSVSQSAKAKKLRFVLVVSQIAMAAILVSSTLLLVREFRTKWTAPVGFEPHGVLTFKLTLNEKQYADAASRRTFFESVAKAVSPPGGEQAAIARFVPFAYDDGQTSVRVPGFTSSEPEGSNRSPAVGFNAVSPSYFATLRIPLLAGRVFTSADGEPAPLVAVVNDAFVARRLRNGTNPIGQRISLSRLKDREAEIVGVVPEIKEGAASVKGYPQIYVPFAQAPAEEAVVALRAGPEALPEIRKRVAAIDPTQPVYQTNTLEDYMDQQLAPFRIISGLLGWFGGLALLLASVGVYGVVAYSASQRTREIGIRAALGAGRPLLIRLFLQQGLTMLQVGMIPGLLGAVAATIGLRSALEELAGASAILPIAITAVLLGLAVLVATLAPAWKASSVDPLAALRYDG
jgi:putative ABC transport system permease protein